MLIKAGKVSVLVFFLICLAFVSINLYLAQKGKKTRLRQIPGLNAITEAIGRAVELGRPVAVDQALTKLATVDGVMGLSYLSYIARKTAELGANFFVGIGAPEVTPVAEDIVESAYRIAGKIDSFDPVKMIRFISSHQWGYTAGWIGMVAREKPAAILITGTLGAEVMLVGEAGQWIGAMQIANCVSTNNIPFLIAAVDYVIMGEEVYAGAAIISEDPIQLGSIKGQDYFRIVTIGLIILGSIFATAGITWLQNLLKI